MRDVLGIGEETTDSFVALFGVGNRFLSGFPVSYVSLRCGDIGEGEANVQVSLEEIDPALIELCSQIVGGSLSRCVVFHASIVTAGSGWRLRTVSCTTGSSSGVETVEGKHSGGATL